MTVPPRREGDESPADPVAELRALPDRYRELLDRRTSAGSAEGAEIPEEAVEQAAQARDLLGATARRLERLLEDSRPVSQVEEAPPKRGHYRVDPEVVAEVLETHAERLARLAETIPDHAADREGIRDGLQSITGELVGEAVSESERRLARAEGAAEERD